MPCICRLAYSVVLQLVLTTGAIWAGTAWFISLAPFLGGGASFYSSITTTTSSIASSSSSALAVVPAFVWPNPPQAMRAWIWNDAANVWNDAANASSPNASRPTWALCNVFDYHVTTTTSFIATDDGYGGGDGRFCSPL